MAKLAQIHIKLASATHRRLRILAAIKGATIQSLVASLIENTLERNGRRIATFAIDEGTPADYLDAARVGHIAIDDGTMAAGVCKKHKRQVITEDGLEWHHVGKGGYTYCGTERPDEFRATKKAKKGA